MSISSTVSAFPDEAEENHIPTLTTGTSNSARCRAILIALYLNHSVGNTLLQESEKVVVDLEVLASTILKQV